MADTTTTDKDLDAFLAPLKPGEEIAPAHRAWMDAQIREALEAAKDGRTSYKTLDEVRAKFGFDAR